MDARQWQQYSRSSQAMFCVKELLSPVDCPSCNVTSTDSLCHALHITHCDKYQCSRCSRLVRTDVGQYHDNRKLLEQYKGHVNCSEVLSYICRSRSKIIFLSPFQVFCSRCEKYVVGFFDKGKDTITHGCFVKALKRTPEHPEGWGSFDLEVNIDNEVLSAVLIHESFDFKKAPESRSAKMVTFSEIDLAYDIVEDFDIDSNTGEAIKVGEHLEAANYIEEDVVDGMMGYEAKPWFPFDKIFTQPDPHRKLVRDVADEHRRRHERLEGKNTKASEHLKAKIQSKLAKDRAVAKLSDYLTKAHLMPEQRGQFAHASRGPVDNAATDQEGEAVLDEEEEFDLVPGTSSTRVLTMLMARLNSAPAPQDYVDRAARMHTDISQAEAEAERRRQRDVEAARPRRQPLPPCPFIDAEAAEGDEDGRVPQMDGADDGPPRKRPKWRRIIVDSPEDSSEDEQPQQPTRPSSPPAEEAAVMLQSSTDDDDDEIGSFEGEDGSDAGEAEGDQAWLRWVLEQRSEAVEGGGDDGGNSGEVVEDDNTPGRFLQLPKHLPPAQLSEAAEVLPRQDGGSKSRKLRVPWKLCSHARFEPTPSPVAHLTPPHRDYKTEPFQNKTLDQLMRYIYRKKFANYVFLSHYGSGFDMCYLLKQAIDMGIHCKVVTRGRKVLRLTLADLNITFLDSFLFVASSLRSIHSSLGLACDAKGTKCHHIITLSQLYSLSSGFFPHMMSSREYYNVKMDHMPPRFFYSPELFKPCDMGEFNKWYDDCVAKKMSFSFTDMLIEYNKIDAMVLFLCGRKLMSGFLELSYDLWVNRLNKDTLAPARRPYYYDAEFHAHDADRSGGAFDFEVGDEWGQNYPENPTRHLKVSSPYPPRRFQHTNEIFPANLHPFSYITLPSFVSALFRAFSLPNDTTLPIANFDTVAEVCNRTSKAEAEWLSWQQHKNAPLLQYGFRHQRQRRFVLPDGKVCYVDGYDPETKTVYEFAGGYGWTLLLLPAPSPL